MLAGFEVDVERASHRERFVRADNPGVGDETGLFIWLHIAQLFLIGGRAYLLWLLVEGFDSRAARVARALILPFVILYTALDAVLGIAWGIAAERRMSFRAPTSLRRVGSSTLSSKKNHGATSSTSAQACSGWPSRSPSSRRLGETLPGPLSCE